MLRLMRSRLLLILPLVLMLVAGGVMRGEFVPPSEVAPLLHREEIPLDVDQMGVLSRDLVKVAAQAALRAGGKGEEEAAALMRASAQCLLLAERLDSAAGTPRRLRAILTKGDSPHDFVGEGEVYEILPAALEFLASRKEAKEKGDVIQFFLDPMRVVARDHPLLKWHDREGEVARWEGAVPELSAYRPREELPESVVGSEMEDSGQSESGEERLVEKGEVEGEVLRKQIGIFESAVLTPLHLFRRLEEDKVETQSRIVPVSLKVRGWQEGWTNLKVVEQEEAEAIQKRISRSLSFLGTRHDEELLKSISGELSFGKEGQYSSRNGDLCQLPIALMLEAALQGESLEEGVLVLGAMDGTGKLSAPPSAWQFVEILLNAEDGEFSRIVASKDLEPYFQAFLTLQKEEFFMRHDVFLVETFDDALNFVLDGQMPKESREACEKMAEIRRVGEGKTVSVFVANPRVIERLDEVRRLEPAYLSAPMLQLRGLNKQPLQMDTKVLACKIEVSLIPLANLPYRINETRELKPKVLEANHRSCREALDPLEKYVGYHDRELFDEAITLTNRVRSLARARERIKDEKLWDKNLYYDTSYYKSFLNFREEFHGYQMRLSAMTGSKPPAKLNQAKRD